MVMRWTMMWLNWSVATINATLQLLDIYRFEANEIGDWQVKNFFFLKQKKKKKKNS